jgi:hypothetical protein
MIDLTLPSALALVAGVSVVMRQVLNANLRSERLVRLHELLLRDLVLVR